MAKSYTYTAAQSRANDLTKKGVNRGWVTRVDPNITITQDNVTKEVLASYKWFGDEPANIADLQRATTVKGVKTTRAKDLRQRVTRAYTVGKGRVDTSMLGVSGGAYRQSSMQLNFILSTTTGREIPLPTKKQFFAAQLDPQGGLVITERMKLNTRAEGDRLLKKIFAGLSNGESVQEMAKTIETAFNYTRSNALRIVRTESARMQNAGNYDQVVKSREAGLESRRKIISTLDDRTRPQSAQVDGDLEVLDEGGKTGYFLYPGGVKVRFPGDSGVAAWDINDREAVIVIFDGIEPETRVARQIEVDKDGNPIVGRTPRSNKPIVQRNEKIQFTDFEAWAKSKGLKKNIYGQLLFP